MRPHPALVQLAAGRALPDVPPSDVGALLASAREHRMTGLLWTRVEAGEVALAVAQTQALAREDLRSRAHNLRLWRLAATVQDRLEPIGCPVAVAKGVAVEARWYDRLGERPCNDLDLLVAPTHLSRFDGVVRALQPNHFLLPHLPDLVADGLLQSISVAVDGHEVDLHPDLLKIEIPMRQRDLAWRRRVQVEGPEGIRVDAVDTEWSLVHLLVHLNKDRFARLLAYADIARILARAEPDWSLVEHFAGREGLGVVVGKALDEVVATLGLDHPRRPVRGGWRATAWERLWPPQQRLEGPVGMEQKVHRLFWIPWLAEGRIREALRWWVRRRLLPPAPLLAISAPDVRGPYLWRLLAGRVRWVVQNRKAVDALHAAGNRGAAATSWREGKA